jgi:Holliday junction resolvasome RuvABC endonuclease subunit
MSGAIKVLGIDPGFASTGWVLVELRPGSIVDVTKVGVVRTEKATKKQNVLASNDNFKRAREISRAIRSLIFEPTPVDAPVPYRLSVTALCAESMSFPRNASTAAKMAMCWGVVADICEDEGLPLLMATPKEIKKAVNATDSSKEAVQLALDSRFGSKLKELNDAAHIPAGFREHVYDALAAVIACLDGELIRLMWKAAL